LPGDAMPLEKRLPFIEESLKTWELNYRIKHESLPLRI
jgi:hypothetical protein